MKKSLNDISRQYERCIDLNRTNVENGCRDRIYRIIEYTRNARSTRGLSIFNFDREAKREQINTITN